jgi:hypothetical protein
MGKNSVSGAGNKIRIFLGSLPLGSRAKPVLNSSLTVDTGGLQNITAGAVFSLEAGSLTTTATPVDLTAKDQLLFSGGALVEVSTTTAASATTVPIRVIRFPANYNDTGVVIANNETAKVIPLSSALTNPIGAGTPIVWSGGAVTFLGGDSPSGSSILTIQPPATGYVIAVAATETGDYDALSRIEGSTDAPLALSPNRSDFVLHKDPTGFREGTVTSQTGNLQLTCNFLSTDWGRKVAEYASLYSVEGREVYVKYEDPEKTMEFIGQLSDYNQPNPADGLITTTFTLNMQGSPIVYASKLVAA